MNFPRLILDTRALCHHMLFSGKDVDSLLLKDGRTINRAEFAFSCMMDRYLMPAFRDFAPINIIAAWDGGRLYRQNLFPKYKARRQAEKLEREPVEIEQLEKLEEYVKRFLAYMGAINVQVNTVEADDTIALLCRALKDDIKRVYTLDADLLQLVDANTVVSLKDDMFFEGDTYHGVPLHLIRLQKSLVGDSSDEYGGVPQIGPKAWEHLISNFGWDGMEQLDSCVKNKDYTLIREALAEKEDPALRKIIENIPTWELMYNLAGLHPEICYGFNGKEKIKPTFYKRLPSADKVLALLQMTGTQHHFPDLEGFLPRFILADAENLPFVIGEMEIKAGKGPLIAFDLESYDKLKWPAFVEALPATQKAFGYVDVLSQVPTGISMCYGDNLQYCFYSPCEHVDTKNVSLTDMKKLLQKMEELNPLSVAHNAAFEEQVIKQSLDYQIRTPHDTMIMSSYVDENDDMGLKDLSLSWFRYKQTEYREVLGDAEDMRFISGQQVLDYGCDDSLVSAHLWHLFSLILKMEGQWDFYSENDTSTVHVFNRAKEIGIRIDYEEMANQEKDDKENIDTGMITIRSELETHCTEHNPDAGRHLFELERPFLYASMRAKGKSDEETQQKLKKIESDLAWAAKYEPFRREKKVPEFKPTVGQITEVATLLCLPADLFGDKKSLSGVAVTQALIHIEDYITTEQQKKFKELLAAAAGKPLKERLGPEYEAFHEFCQGVLAEFCCTFEEFGDELNLDSSLQMQKLLYCKLGLPVRKRSKVQRKSQRDKLGFKGAPGTDAKAIKAAIAEDCDENDWRRAFLKKLLSVKESMTRFELFYRPYPLWKHPADGCIHPSVRNCGTVTRRPSGTCPNILAVSKGKPRNFFLPRYDDHVIVSPDYSGQELRLTASESKDPVLIDAYTGGGTYIDEDGMLRYNVKDIHTVTACSFTLTMLQREYPSDFLKLLKTLDIPNNGLMPYDTFRFLLNAKEEDLISKYGPEVAAMKVQDCINSCRYMAKIVNFLIIYGGSASTLAMNLGIRSDFAQQLMDMVFKAYARLGPWQQEVIKHAYDYGYVKTAYGTWKHVSKDIRSRDGGLRSRAERQAVNQTIQGCAADILKIALTQAHKQRVFEETQSFLIAPVYDEITCSVPIRHLFEFCQRMRTIMNVTPPGHAVPMMAEFAIGPSWGTQTELGDNPSQRAINETIIKYGLERYAA